MPIHLPSIEYPPAGDGVWGPVTSTLNWCEEDYYATIYCAEIVNSITNLAFVYLAYKGISNCIRHGHDTVFLLGFISYLAIGLASFLFHSTLKYGMQLFDELSMVYTTSIMFYAVFSHKRSVRGATLVLILIAGIAVFITGYYVYIKDPLFHQNAFALLTLVVFARSVYGMEVSLRPSRRAKKRAENGRLDVNDDAEQARMDRRDLLILRTMYYKMIPGGLGCFAIGFLIWNLDNHFCPALRSWRHGVGLPWGVFLEGHGWWHIFTGIAQYFNLTWSIWLRYCFDGEQDRVDLVWPSTFTSMPTVECVKKVDDNVGHDKQA